jgi:hypothetical protein
MRSRSLRCRLSLDHHGAGFGCRGGVAAALVLRRVWPSMLLPVALVRALVLFLNPAIVAAPAACGVASGRAAADVEFPIRSHCRSDLVGARNLAHCY